MRKQSLPKIFLLTVITVFSALLGNAQNIHVVPNPSAPDLFAWTGSGALSGYAGTPIMLNNTLVMEYNPTGISDVSAPGFHLQLAVYKDGDSLHLIPNPDSGPGVYFQSIQIVFNNKLFFIYLNAVGTQQLASFDGTSITLYTNPDGGLGYLGSPRILNNILYVAYSNAAGVTQFGTFNGSGITLIPNPDNSTIGFFNNYSIIFNGKICSRYVEADGTKHLANYDGTSWTLIPNPDNTTRGVYPTFPTIYHNKLYWAYYSATNQYQYLEYDGTNNPTLIPNPENSSTNNGGVTGFIPIVYNDTLFFQYLNTSNVYQLAKFGGSSISLIPNHDNTTYGYWYTPIIYQNNLYIFYLPADGSRHIAQYQTSLNTLKVIPNPDGGAGYWSYPIVYDDNLYFVYSNAQSFFQLGYFNGTSINLITNPSGIYNGADGNNGYTGFPIIFNNFLYMQFGGVPYGNAGNLAYFDGSTLPVTFLNFDGVIQNGKSLLSWSTANEINNKGFEVQRSDNGQTFTDIGFVAGHNNSSTVNNYTYTDVKVVSGANYYRLKQIDNNGNFAYSSVIKLDYSAFAWNILGNPVSGNSWIQLQLDKSSEVSVQIVSMNGNIIQTINKGNLSAGTYSFPINLSEKSAGLYFVRLIVDGQFYSKKIIK